MLLGGRLGWLIYSFSSHLRLPKSASLSSLLVNDLAFNFYEEQRSNRVYLISPPNPPHQMHSPPALTPLLCSLLWQNTWKHYFHSMSLFPFLFFNQIFILNSIKTILCKVPSGLHVAICNGQLLLILRDYQWLLTVAHSLFLKLFLHLAFATSPISLLP